MKKIISYSLWGDNPKYCVGAIKNAHQRQNFYPDWISRFYVHEDVSKKYVEELNSLKNTEVIIKTTKADWKGMFWRFEAISDEDVSVMICRDTDSRLSERETEAVKEWLDSPMLFHIMRDHPYHNAFVLGGMFGVKKGLLDDMKDLCDNFSQKDEYGTDYQFFESIKNRISPLETMVHDEFRGGLTFPTERKNFEYIGEIFDEKDYHNPEHKNALIHILKNVSR
jgi:hypothetical protein|tara:strand:+ start:1190 stop:1861 length:672 start_codon:yes stop_codon:yes gene_type:complete